MHKLLIATALAACFAAPLAFAEADPAAPVKTVSHVFLTLNSPISYDTVNDTVKKLNDGNEIRRSYISHHYRDSAGRTRDDSEDDDGVVTRITFRDVDGKNYYLNPQRKTATTYVDTAAPKPAAAKPKPTQRYVVTTTALGSREIEGVMTTGTLSTSEIPAGQRGNAAPIVTTRESWYASGIGTMYSKSSDPESGTSTMNLTNLKREEPPREMLADLLAQYTVTTIPR